MSSEEARLLFCDTAALERGEPSSLGKICPISRRERPFSLRSQSRKADFPKDFATLSSVSLVTETSLLPLVRAECPGGEA